MRTKGRPQSTNIQDRSYNTSPGNVNDFVKESFAAAHQKYKKESWNTFVKNNYARPARKK